jgi:orotate phosphoribosyltransferase-like protein
LSNYPRFDGHIEIEPDYLILDDTLTMGGTLASLRGYIESQGGRVIMATVLTGHQGAANISISDVSSTYFSISYINLILINRLKLNK